MVNGPCTYMLNHVKICIYSCEKSHIFICKNPLPEKLAVGKMIERKSKNAHAEKQKSEPGKPKMSDRKTWRRDQARVYEPERVHICEIERSCSR